MGRFFSLLAFLFVTANCRADGMIIPPTVLPAQVRIPDQRALIQFSKGVERLVIETRFTGAGTNFAWVVPLPAPPVIEEASTGLFPTLQCLFQPRLRHEVPSYFQLFLGLLAAGYLLRFVRPGPPVNGLDVLACLGVGLAIFAPAPFRGVGSFIAFLGLLRVVASVREGRDWRSDFNLFYWIFLLFLGFILVGMLSPALSGRSAGISASPTPRPTVSILDRKLVGIFETTTISSHDPVALQAWLKANGFTAPANRDQAIASYVKDGWIFVAAKIRRDDPALQTSTPHPLSFTFKTEKTVYPMRLTGIDNGPVQVDLYLFGSAQAEAPHFKVERCTLPTFPKLPVHHGIESVSYSDFSPKPESLQIVHPLLRKWVDSSTVATKLTAKLSRADMLDDVWISWVPFSEKETLLFSHQAAWFYAINWGAGVFAAVLLPAFIFGPVSVKLRKWPARFVGLSIGSGFVLAMIIFLLLPKTEVRIILRHRPFDENFWALWRFTTAPKSQLT